MIRTIAVALAAAALGGCASLNSVESEVASFSHWPAGRVPSTYAFERLPSQQANPQQAQLLEDAARPALESVGFAPAPEGGVADVTVQLGARITAYETSPWADPFWYGGPGYWYGPRGYYARPFWGPYWGPRWGPYWGPYGGYGYGGPYSYTTYEREVAILIRDKTSGEPLYEARARSSGNWAGVSTVLPAMYVAVMRDFPSGSPSNPHRVVVETQPAP